MFIPEFLRDWDEILLGGTKNANNFVVDSSVTYKPIFSI
jgi:hypothetical protein